MGEDAAFLFANRKKPAKSSAPALAQKINDFLAEEKGFEPSVACTTAVFKTAAFVHSATPPDLYFCFYLSTYVMLPPFGSARRARNRALAEPLIDAGGSPQVV